MLWKAIQKECCSMCCLASGGVSIESINKCCDVSVMTILFTWHLDFGYYSALFHSCDVKFHSHMGQDVAIKRQHFGFYSERKILHAGLNCKTLLWVLCINFSLVIWNNLSHTEKNSFEAAGSSFLVSWTCILGNGVYLLKNTTRWISNNVFLIG